MTNKTEPISLFDQFAEYAMNHATVGPNGLIGPDILSDINAIIKEYENTLYLTVTQTVTANAVKCHHDERRGMLISNPPQYLCEYCDGTWVYGTSTPTCKAFKQQHTDFRKSIDKIFGKEQ